MINLEALKNIILNVVNKYTVRNQNGSRKQVIGELEFHRNRLYLMSSLRYSLAVTLKKRFLNALCSSFMLDCHLQRKKW